MENISSEKFLYLHTRPVYLYIFQFNKMLKTYFKKTDSIRAVSILQNSNNFSLIILTEKTFLKFI